MSIFSNLTRFLGRLARSDRTARRDGARNARPVRRRRRLGMTLIESMVAVTILGSVTLGLGAFMAKFTRTATDVRIRTKAAQLAAQRIETIKSAGQYDSLAKFVATETNLPGYAGLTRQTIVTQVGGDSTSTVDYRIVTVEVTGPGLQGPVRKTTAITR
jgi:prepilin-type N-terminal cleavage/methylation domain-containing protein